MVIAESTIAAIAPAYKSRSPLISRHRIFNVLIMSSDYVPSHDSYLHANLRART